MDARIRIGHVARVLKVCHGAILEIQLKAGWAVKGGKAMLQRQ